MQKGGLLPRLTQKREREKKGERQAQIATPAAFNSFFAISRNGVFPI
jgi:hypothetical protein